MHGYKWPINCTRTRTATRQTMSAAAQDSVLNMANQVGKMGSRLNALRRGRRPDASGSSSTAGSTVANHPIALTQDRLTDTTATERFVAVVRADRKQRQRRQQRAGSSGGGGYGCVSI